MSPTGTARLVYKAIRADPDSIAAIRAEYQTLALEAATSNDFGFDLTSSTVNGQSFGGTRSITKASRLAMLGQLTAMLDSDAAISSRSIPTF